MAKALSREIWIVGAKRTAFGAFGGALKDLTATDLAVDAAKAAIAQAGADPATVEQVVFGNVQQTSADAIYLARHVGLRAGPPIATPALTVNRLCGSGFQAIINGAEQILLGESEVVLVGGTESMSQAPHIVRGARWGLAFGKPHQLEDSLWDSLTDSYTGMPMAITAENLAEQYGITRQECDDYALRSQKAWAAANEGGHFKDEIAPIELKSKKGSIQFTVDEHPRPKTTAEILAKLPPVFKKDGVVTAGNASGICDGAAALLICSKEAGLKNGWKPLAKLTQWASRAAIRRSWASGRRRRFGGRSTSRATRSPTSISSRSTRRSRRSISPSRRSSASIASAPTSTAAPSRSATRSARRARASRRTSCTSCAAVVRSSPSARPASAAVRASPSSSSRFKRRD